MNAAAGVAYLALDGCQRRFFRCDSYRATLSTSACADRWNAAQQADAHDAYRFEKCRACPIGAAHAGRPFVHYSPYYGSAICPRCRTFATRMIGGTRCISCYNREREFKVGRNGKGNMPTFRFDLRRIGVVTEAGYVEVSNEFTADTAELVLNVLRQVPGKVMFCRPTGGAAAISMAQLGRRYKSPERRPVRSARRVAARSAS
jgi:hypothetical protein